MWSERTLVTLAMLATVGTFCALSLRLGAGAAMAPLAVSIPATLLAAWQLAVDLRSPEKSKQKPEGVSERSLFLAWIGFLGSLYLAGFLIAVPAFVALYARWQAGTSVRACLGIAAAAFLTLFLGFEILLRTELYRGQVALLLRM